MAGLIGYGISPISRIADVSPRRKIRESHPEKRVNTSEMTLEELRAYFKKRNCWKDD